MDIERDIKNIDNRKFKGKMALKAYSQIKEMLYNNELSPGQKLIRRDLALRLGMSIMPITEALNRLQSENLIKHDINRGYYVGEIDEKEAEELFWVREVLEVSSIPIILNNLTNDNLRSLKEKFMEFKDAENIGLRRKIMLIDSEFHLKLIEISNQRFMYRFLKEIFEHIYLRYPVEYLTEDRIQQAAKEHKEILKYLNEKKCKKLQRLISVHIKNGLKHLKKVLNYKSKILI